MQLDAVFEGLHGGVGEAQGSVVLRAEVGGIIVGGGGGLRRRHVGALVITGHR